MPSKTLLVKSRVEVGILSHLPCDFCLSETFCKLLFFCWSSFTRLFHSFPQLYSFISSFCASRILSALCFVLDCVRTELWDAGIFFKQCRGRCRKGERCRVVLCRSLLFLLFFALFNASFAALLIAIALSASLILFFQYNEFFYLMMRQNPRAARIENVIDIDRAGLVDVLNDPTDCRVEIEGLQECSIKTKESTIL